MKNEQIINFRVDNDLTQKELAEKMGRSQSWLSGLETGHIRPSKEMTIKIISMAKKNGIDIKYEQLRPRKERKKSVKLLI
jgi:transcriptional regulator with XRE-family HTH domain